MTYKEFFGINETDEVIEDIASTWEQVRGFQKISRRKFGAEMKRYKKVEIPSAVKRTAQVVLGYTPFDGQLYPNGQKNTWYFVPCGHTKYSVAFTIGENDIQQQEITTMRVICDRDLSNIVFVPRR